MSKSEKHTADWRQRRKKFVPLDPHSVTFACTERISYLEEIPQPRKYNIKYKLSCSFGILEVNLELRLEMLMLTNVGSRALFLTNFNQPNIAIQQMLPSMLER